MGIPNARCFVADNGLVSTVWCKHMTFSDKDRILMEKLCVVKNSGAKNTIKKFPNKGKGLWELKRL